VQPARQSFYDKSAAVALEVRDTIGFFFISLLMMVVVAERMEVREIMRSSQGVVGMVTG
jgi:hypothetical protein